MESGIFLAFVGGVIVVGACFAFLRRKRKLSDSDFQKFSQKILETKKLDPAHAIMESHKIFSAAIAVFLGEKVKHHTSAQKISRVQKRFPNPKQVWNFHRLRNRIAHETDTRVSAVQADQARENFIRALRSLTK
jgi:hypothetical protein